MSGSILEFGDGEGKFCKTENISLQRLANLVSSISGDTGQAPSSAPFSESICPGTWEQFNYNSNSRNKSVKRKLRNQNGCFKIL
jgi:hypothetical protein